MTAHECEEYIEEPPQRKRYALRKPERQRDFLRLKLTLPSERRTGKPPPDPLLVLCRLQIHRGSRCSTVTKIPDTTEGTGLGEGRVIEVGEGSGLIDDGERGEFCDEMGLVNE